MGRAVHCACHGSRCLQGSECSLETNLRSFSAQFNRSVVQSNHFKKVLFHSAALYENVLQSGIRCTETFVPIVHFRRREVKFITPCKPVVGTTRRMLLSSLDLLCSLIAPDYFVRVSLKRLIASPVRRSVGIIRSDICRFRRLDNDGLRDHRTLGLSATARRITRLSITVEIPTASD